MSKATDKFNTWMVSSGAIGDDGKGLYVEYILSESQTAMIETLISRHKLGYREWTIPKTASTTKVLKYLSELGVTRYRPQNVEAAYYAELTNGFLEANQLVHVVERKGESLAINNIIEDLNAAGWKYREYSNDRLEGKKQRELRDTSAESENAFEKIRQEFIKGAGSNSAILLPDHPLPEVAPLENSRDWQDLRATETRSVTVTNHGGTRVTVVVETLSAPR